MNPRKRKLSEDALLPPVLPPKRFHLPEDIIIYMGKFLHFEDYRNFIRSIWPNNGESESIRAKLWLMSTYRKKTTFMNGKRLEVEYNFDDSRRGEDRFLINVDYLLPIFNRVPAELNGKFTSVSNLRNFVRTQVNMNKCSEYGKAFCPCHLINKEGRGWETFVKPREDTCRYGHFQHYCSYHVIHWLNVFKNTTIQLHQKSEFMSEQLAESSLLLLDDHVYVRGVEMRWRGPLLIRMV